MSIRRTGSLRRWAALVAAYAMLVQVVAATLAPLAQARQAEVALLGAITCHSEAAAATGDGAPAAPAQAAHDCCLAGVCAADAAPLRAEPNILPSAPRGHVAAVFIVASPRVSSTPERDARRSRGPPLFS